MSANRTIDFYKKAFDDPFDAAFLKEQFLLTPDHVPRAQVPAQTYRIFDVLNLEYIGKMVGSLSEAASGVGSSVPSALANEDVEKNVLYSYDLTEAEWADSTRSILYYMYGVKKITQFAEALQKQRPDDKVLQTIEKCEFSLEQIDSCGRNMSVLPYQNMKGLIMAIGAAGIKEHLFEWQPEEWIAVLHEILALEKGLEFLTWVVVCRIYFDQMFSWDFLDVQKCEDFPIFEHTGVWNQMTKPYFELPSRIESLRTDMSGGVVPGSPRALRWLVEWNEHEPAFNEIKDEEFMRQR